jgi:hypothetical protein
MVPMCPHARVFDPQKHFNQTTYFHRILYECHATSVDPTVNSTTNNTKKTVVRTSKAEQSRAEQSRRLLPAISRHDHS